MTEPSFAEIYHLPEEVLLAAANHGCGGSDRDALSIIIEMQNYLQVEAYGNDFRNMAEALKPKYIADMVLACTDELHEALNEVGWKPWASSRHVNAEAFKGELIDALHFLVNLFLLAGMDSREVLRLYLEKNRRNLERQKAGYDGVAEKCPTCKRAIDDVRLHDALSLYSVDVSTFSEPNKVITYCSFNCYTYQGNPA